MLDMSYIMGENMREVARMMMKLNQCFNQLNQDHKYMMQIFAKFNLNRTPIARRFVTQSLKAHSLYL